MCGLGGPKGYVGGYRGIMADRDRLGLRRGESRIQ